MADITIIPQLPWYDIFQAIMWIGGFCVLGYVIYWRKWYKRLHRYPINALIIQPRQGGGHFCKTDKLRPVYKDKGKIRKYDFLHAGITRPIDFPNIILGKKKHFVILFEGSKGNYAPLKLPSNPSTKEFEFAESEDLKFWKTVEDKDARIRWSWSGFFQKYMPFLLLIAFAFCFLLMVYATFEYGLTPILTNIQGSAQAITGGVHALTEASNRLIDVYTGNITTGEPIPITPPPPPS